MKKELMCIEYEVTFKREMWGNKPTQEGFVYVKTNNAKAAAQVALKKFMDNNILYAKSIIFIKFNNKIILTKQF